MNNSFTQALALQGRVIWALALREIHGKHGRYRIGYLWQLIKTGFSIAVFWGIRSIGHFRAPGGMETPIFLLMGFIPWFIISETLKMTMEAVRTNKALLTFPQITPLDLCLGSAVVVWGTEVFIMFLYLILMHILGYTFSFVAPITMMFALLGCGLFGLGAGLVLAALTLYVPVIERIVPMVMRILFFTSGLFFSPQQMSARFGNWVMWNPIANFIELLRSSMLYREPAGHIKVEFIIWVTMAMLALGLLLERFVRAKQEML